MMTERKAAGPLAAPSYEGRASSGARLGPLASVLLLATTWASLFSAALAGAQTALPMQEVTWAHPAPGRVQRFVIFISPVAGLDEAARQIDVGKPAGLSVANGAMRYFSAIVPAFYDEFVAVAAVAPDGSRSPLSSWSVASPTVPGQPRLIQP